MPPLNLLIKPASSSCNLRCKYCFYHSIAENRMIESYGIMSIETLESLVVRALEYADQECTFAFQGGEPTLAGLDFFKELIQLEKKHNTKNIRINNALQTNGVIIDGEWAEFLSDNHFLVGLSLDGPKDIHDSMRVDARDKGSFTKVMNTVQLFNKYKVEYNILFVVNGYVARHANKIYQFFKKNDFKYLQFIPCLDPLNEKPGEHDYSLTPQKFTVFLKNLFDCWYDDMVKGNMVSIRYFDNLVGTMMGIRPEACGMLGECSCQFVVEADGGVYPCDFYVVDEWYLGNIEHDGFDELRSTAAAERFVETSRHIDPKCKKCKWVNLCRGGCRRSREPFEDGKPVLNYYCSSYMEFFEYAAPRMYQIAQKFSKR
ncbi:MAG: anaerobic sulfatase maturase [Clostridia bacterium]